MPHPLEPLLTRIAEALERLAPGEADAPSFARARLYRYEAAGGGFSPAPDYGLPLDLLVGVDSQKQRFGRNLERFSRGLPANHALMWGVRGTGKSSLAKAAFMDLARTHPELRLVEVDRDEVAALPALFDVLRGRSERFLVLCDDLSFEEGAAAAKTLKSALEGGVAGPPANVLLVATSNRRHLMPREMMENERSTAIAPSEAVEEKVSLSDRCGLWLGFHRCSQDEYLAMVAGYAEHYRLRIAKAELTAQALEWAATRGSRSGRVAWQFVQDLAGRLGVVL